jgi:glycoside/pentoside/hexuronide:cation symporter, GPH family
MSIAPASAVEARANESLKVDVGYGLITLGSTTIWSVLNGWLLYFYLPPDDSGPALVPVALYGGTMLVVRVINAMLAPPIGYLSDRTRSRWGRRLPYMAASALPMLALFALLWTPPVAAESLWNLIYLAAILLFYNLAYSLNQIPYTALLPEIAVTESHRVRMSAWSSSLFMVGAVLGGIAGPVIERLGYGGAARVYAVACLPLFYLPFLVLRERYPSRGTKVPSSLSFRDAIALMLRNRAFQIMTLTGIFYWGVTAATQAIMPYIVTEICLLSIAETFDFYIPALLTSLLCYPLVMWLANRFGKWRVFATSLLLTALVLPGLMAIGPWFSLPLKMQGLIWITIQAFAMSGITMLPATFGAEITDYDEDLTGERREGTYYAAWGLIDQVVQGLTAAALPLILLLGRSHTDPRGPLGVRAVGLVGGIAMLIAFFIFLKYPFRGKSRSEGETL